MIQLTYCCPHCDEPSRVPLDSTSTVLTCRHCGHATEVPEGAIVEERVERCVICPSTDLYVRKDFSQTAGVSIVILGMVLSTVAWAYHYIYLTYAILFVMALIDVLLYVLVGNLLQCYRCQAQYRGVAGLEGRERFHLETHERHRQQVARLKQTASGS
ncbi:MAG: hypothetical protein U0935_03815 [Pirellulales bacterium]